MAFDDFFSEDEFNIHDEEVEEMETDTFDTGIEDKDSDVFSTGREVFSTGKKPDYWKVDRS